MSDRQRLKDSDEILSSLGRGLPQQDETAPPGNIGEQPSVPTRRRGRGRPPKARIAPERYEPEGRDTRELDFGKYDLLKPAAEKELAPPVLPAPPARPRRGRGRPTKKSPPATEELVLPDDTIRSAEPEPSAEAAPPDSAPRRPRRAPSAKRTPAKPAEPETPPADKEAAVQDNIGDTVIKEYGFEDLRSAEPAPAPVQKQEPETLLGEDGEGELRSRLLHDEEERDVFMRELSQQFEEKFTRQFATEIKKTPRPKQAEDKKTPEKFDFWAAEPEEVKPDVSDIHEPMLIPEAEDFVSRFKTETLAEEENLSKDFKDTLAEKFMRERERYLRELGIASALDEENRAREQETIPGDEPLPPAPEPEPGRSPRRMLDFQIVPEMHMQEGSGPVHMTYTRGGQLRPQISEPDDADADVPDEPPLPPAPAREAAQIRKPAPQPGKKSSEQLLLELAAQTKAAEERLNAARAPARPAQAKAASHPRPAAPAADAKTPRKAAKAEKDTPKRYGKIRAAVFSLLAALALTAGVTLALEMNWFQALTTLSPGSGVSAAESGIEGDAAGLPDGGTITVYENRSHTERGFYDDVLVKRSGIQLSNMSVANLLVISETPVEGEVTLSDVSVDGAIHVLNCAVSTLNLVDVVTPRLIVNNSDTQVAITISGNTDVGVIELRTPSQIDQMAVTGSFTGVRDVILWPEDAGGTMNAWLSGLNLNTLSTWGDTILRLSDTFVSSMVCEGSVSLDGSGRILNMAVSAEPDSVSGLSAAIGPDIALPLTITDTSSKPLLVVLKGVSVSNLNMKSPAEMNISTTIDTMTLSDNMSLTGGGSIGSLMVNAKPGGSRLVIDIDSMNVPTLTAEAETRLSVTGSGKVNTLICNASVYALGNKVNHMIVNADYCFYEVEPDRITRASGVLPPGSVAENPNLDFSASSRVQSSGNSGTNNEDEVGTTCGHPRESGGFIHGDGSKSNPFQISAPAQLAHISAHAASFFIQTEDIDIADDAQFTGGFPVIAGDDTPFSGEYDGMGYSIRNLRIISDKKNVGLFGSNTGTIKNVHIVSGEISSTLNSGAFVGGVVGFNYDAAQTLNCSNRAKITGKDSYAGGIVGYNYSARIRDCYNAAKIVSGNNAGGIVGVNRGEEGSISGCYNAGTVEGAGLSGGVAGSNEGKIINCYYLEDTAPSGLGSGQGSALVKTSDELMSVGMVDEIAAGNMDTLWTRGTQGEGNYNYPVLKKPAA